MVTAALRGSLRRSVESIECNRLNSANQPLTRSRTARFRPYFARSMYSPVVGLTRILSPVATNSGTFTVTPFSSFAGFVDAVFVAVFITGFVSTIVNVIDYQMNPAAAVSAPRIHAQWQPDRVTVEPEVPADVLDALIRRGHAVTRTGDPAAVQAIVIGSTTVTGASDTIVLFASFVSRSWLATSARSR